MGGPLTYTLNGAPFEDDDSPTANPTSSPTPSPTANLSSTPTESPSTASKDCEDDEEFRYKNQKKKDCDWVGKGFCETSKCRKRIKKKCNRKHNKIHVFDWCPATCGKVGLGDCKV